MTYRFTVSGTLNNLNDYINANRRNPYIGNKMKQANQNAVEYAIKFQRKHLNNIQTPVVIHYKFYEPNRKRDLDNISGMAHKVVQDAMVAQHVLPNDGWRHISGYTDAFFVDANNPRIEVFIEEVI